MNNQYAAIVRKTETVCPPTLPENLRGSRDQYQGYMLPTAFTRQCDPRMLEHDQCQ